MIIGIDTSRANLHERTGTEWYAFYIIRHMVQQDRTIRFLLYFDRPPLPELQNLGPNVNYRVLRWPFRVLWSQLRLSLEMLWRPPDVLFVPAHTVPVIHRHRTVITLHDVGFERFPELYGQRHIGGNGFMGTLLNLLARTFTFGKYGNSELDYHRWSARFAVHHAQKIITISHYTKSEIEHFYQIPSSKITVVYHGFDREVYRPSSAATVRSVQSRFHLQSPYIIFTGRLEKKKNLRLLLDAFSLAQKEITDLHLVLIGKKGLGWEIAASPETQSRVHVLGWQPNEVYIPLLTGASALVFLSQYEGFGMPLLEAFAVGTPVVATKVASIPEVSGGAASLVPNNDPARASRAIIQSVKNMHFRRQLQQRGWSRVNRFTWTAATLETLAVIRGM